MGQTDKVEDWSLIYPSDSFSALGLVVWYQNIPCIISVLILYIVAFVNSFLSLLFEIENIRWTLWNMLKTASLTAIIMLYVCVYVWICFWHICYKYNKNFSVYQIALISASIQSTIYDFSKHFVIIVCSLEKVSISNRPCCDPYISVLAESQRVIYVMQLLCWFSVYL